jgi:transcriptional regulator with XRE-family HTH domain
MLYKRLRDLREDNDFTQQYVANYLKINRVVYSRYELGNREIPVSYLIELSKLYDASIDYIVGITNKKDIIR